MLFNLGVAMDLFMFKGDPTKILKSDVILEDRYRSFFRIPSVRSYESIEPMIRHRGYTRLALSP